MPKWIVRTNCEYSIQVEADNGDSAIDAAQMVALDDWEQAWASAEAEREES